MEGNGTKEPWGSGPAGAGDGKRQGFRLEHWHTISLFLMLYDMLAVNAAYFCGLWIRFDCRYSMIPAGYFHDFLGFAPIYTVVCLLVFLKLHLYNSIWRFVSYSEFLRTALSSAATSLFHTIGITLLFGRMPISYYLFGTVFQFLLVLGVRFSYRFVLLERGRLGRKASADAGRVMLIGAGSAGQMILRDLQHAKELAGRVCCIIDDNPNKWNRFIDGIPVVGGRDAIPGAVERYRVDRIYLAIPSASAAEKRAILDICKETGCELKSLPGMYQLVNGEVSLKNMKDVAVEDLLGREPVEVNTGEIFSSLRGRRILVTGGGGSIGSELCRQVAKHQPGMLIVFDVYENNAYEIEQELRREHPGLDLRVLIGSVRDSRRIRQVFDTYHPEIVYHAAAHKHVPLMEASPCEAIKNNVVGTYKTAYAALMSGCGRFVLVSTDKAVNPTSVMGASKRICEMVVQAMDRVAKTGMAGKLPLVHAHRDEPEVDGMEGESLRTDEALREAAVTEETDSADTLMNETTLGPETDTTHKIPTKTSILQGAASKTGDASGKKPTEFVAVRFGNVLGSNGSVIPLFKKQIENGGPVTVTHKEITRYFMTIPEAVSLILQAGTYAKGGEIFVLDMGEPMKIDTLARNLIKLSGFRPDIDIPIVYTGLRPGEKLYEEKLMSEEGLRTTPNKLIHIGNPLPFDHDVFFEQLLRLIGAAYRNEDDVIELVQEIVPTYKPNR